MQRGETMAGHIERERRLSLNPLDFDEALKDLLQVEPPAKDKKEPAPPKQERRPKKRNQLDESV